MGFEGIAVAEFVDVILGQGDQGDEAMYYLLHQRLGRQLRERYEVFQRQLCDDFEDVMEDFFLYLREGRGNQLPYQSLRQLKSKEAFEKWVLTTFRNYLSNRAQAEERIAYAAYSEPEASESDEFLSDEQKVTMASQLIAYSHQVFYPRGRYIFLRSLLTMLNKQKALPNEEVARALGMTDISYRVTLHRMRCNLVKFRQRLLQGEQLRLDEQHRQMAESICRDFDQLYPVLLAYYTQTIDTLQCADAIHQLRRQHYEATGIMAHEPEPGDKIVTTAAGFWEKLNRLLIK